LPDAGGMSLRDSGAPHDGAGPQKPFPWPFRTHSPTISAGFRPIGGGMKVTVSNRLRPSPRVCGRPGRCD